MKVHQNLLLTTSPYTSYSYAYPHKTAYRPLASPIPLTEVWAGEKREALSLYLHIPFCEMRCGFCNLFTTVNPRLDFKTAYLASLEREARRVREALGSAHFAQLAIGGGTPTYLNAQELARLFDLTENLYGLDLQNTPISVETSPGTADLDKLALLRERGVDRISIGVQSFQENEVHLAGRSQETSEVEAALERIKKLGFPTLNIDLIYGLPEQSLASWLASLRHALRFEPAELYLYPLYTRPLTGLGRLDKSWDDHRLDCYRAGRALLLEAGYVQVSMRMFQLKKVSAASKGPSYCCQEDGMIGLGCGARSYTRALHYSSEYAVSARSVRAILADYIARPEESFGLVSYGYQLDADDQRRRFVIQSLLQVVGLDRTAYWRQFGSDVLTDLPSLSALVELELATLTQESLRLTEAGLERSDVIGPWLYSAKAQALMEGYELR